MNESIHDVCDYVIDNVINSGEVLSNLKLQKLLYYIQAWHLVFEDTSLFDNKFEAWVHGPVSRDLFDRFSSNKSLYSDIHLDDIRDNFSPASLNEETRSHINRVLSVYAKFSGSQLEEMTHREEPWAKAREGVQPWERCSKVIDEQVMKSYYSARL